MVKMLPNPTLHASAAMAGELALRFLRSAWINMNVIWAAALIVTAVAAAPVR